MMVSLDYLIDLATRRERDFNTVLSQCGRWRHHLSFEFSKFFKNALVSQIQHGDRQMSKRATNSLLLSYVENIIDEDEFVLLYEFNNSKEIYPFWKYDKFDLENMDEAQCKREFRFLRSHIYDLKNVLKFQRK